jgi:hypothetical protein
MFGRRYLVLGSVICAVLSLSLFFTNCSKGNGAAEDSPSDQGRVEGLAGINYFREAVPAKFCGEEGYGYILRSYVGPECGTCHSMNGMFPPFGDSDLGKSYSWARTLGKENFLSKVTDNRFCGPDCNLDTRGDIYKALVEWLDHPDNCN